MNPSPTTPSKLAIIFAGENHTVTLLDQSTVAVFVRAMPARHLGRVLKLADHEAELLDFVVQLPRADAGGYDPVPEGWADNLSPESHDQLYEAAKRLNFSRAVNWGERQIAAKRVTGELGLKMEEVMSPVMERLLEPMKQQILDLLVSLAKQPTATDAPLPKS